jgi:Uma2 family endonuclease
MPRRATIDDLYRVEGRAELVAGQIVRYPLGGDLPSTVAGAISAGLRDHAKATGTGRAYGGGLAYVVPSLASGRESFSPNASFYSEPLPSNRMRFIEGPPTFAVEVRGENDYTDVASMSMAAKREDYFQAGTLVVWDVDPVAETVARYRADNPDKPTIFRRGDVADAEPAIPGWNMAVDEIFAA